MKLVTIPVSNFCEKARWGLDRAGLEFSEQAFAPVLHRAAVMRRGSKTAPVLVDGSNVVRGSTEILQRCDRDGSAPALFPSDPDARREVIALVERFDTRLGPALRAWLYSWAIGERGELARYCTAGVPAAQRIAVKVAMPAFARILKLAMRLGPETYEKCVARIDGELEFVAQLRSDGRTYLVGDAFSAADLTFAALIGSAVRAPGYGGSRFTFPEPRGELAAQGAAWRDTPAGNYAYEIYRDWR